MEVIEREEGIQPKSILGRLNPFVLLRDLYHWVLSWAETRYGIPALFLVAFAESSFFPVPPDVLIVALTLSLPSRAFLYAAVSSVGSVLGGILGYVIGLKFMELIGWPILTFYGIQEKFLYLQDFYRQYDAWAVAIAGFTPIPYKLFTIGGGACRINFTVFVLASALGRSLRFFAVGGLLYVFGESIRKFIERYFNLLSILFVILFTGGLVVFRWVI